MNRFQTTQTESSGFQWKQLAAKPAFYAILIAALIGGYGFWWLMKFSLLPDLVFWLLLAAALVVLAISWILLLTKSGRLFHILGWILLAAFCGLNVFSTFYLRTTYSALEQMNEHKEGEDFTTLYVMKSSVLNDPAQLDGRKIGVLRTINREHSNAMLEWLDSQGIQYELVEYDSSITMAKNLKGYAIDAIILDDAYISVIEDYNDLNYFHDDIVALYQIPYTVQTSVQEAGEVNVTSEPFNILISGIDTYGGIGTQGRSDVNMIMTVNPKTRVILMTTIPRDYYVETACPAEAGCAAGQMDKLTHMGYTGIETTEATLSKLFGIDIDFYVRVNFSSLIQIIDELGGVDVHNVDSFTTQGYTFEPGIIHMDGSMALAFSRERYSFTDGDRERGRNQMRVIEAILDKVMSPAILTNYSSLLQSVANSVQMNIPASDVAALVKMQLEDPEPWKFYATSVSGSDDNQYAYALGDYAYVMIPNETSVANAKLNIQAVEIGEIPPYVNYN